MAESHDPPASPPPPPPPVALTPGHRATQFEKLYNQTLSKTLTSVSYSNFSSCFPTMAQQSPDTLKSVHNAFLARLEELARNEFEKICMERRVVEGLNGLEDLVAEAKRRKSRGVEGEKAPVPPHLVPAKELVTAYLAPQHAQQQSQLNAKLQTVQSQNSKLFETIQAQRREIEALTGGLERYVKDLEGAVEKLDEIGDLRREVMAADEEMKSL